MCVHLGGMIYIIVAVAAGFSICCKSILYLLAY
jgi:hypothetical protein